MTRLPTAPSARPTALQRAPVWRGSLALVTGFAGVATAALLAGPAHAQSADPAAEKAFATTKNCMSCHAIDKKLVGPAYKDVAAKYKGDPAAAGRLATKIIKGGAGAWGVVAMPANPQVSEADAKRLVAWVLTAK